MRSLIKSDLVAHDLGGTLITCQNPSGHLVGGGGSVS